MVEVLLSRRRIATLRVIDGICQQLRVAAHQFAREGVGQLVVGIYSPVIEETFLTEQIFPDRRQS